MKKKRLFQSVRLLLVAMFSTLVGAVAVACAKEDKKAVLTPGPESGLYYCDAEGVDYVFTLSDGNQFTLMLDDFAATGEYKINGDSIELKFSKTMTESVVATLEGNTIVVRYKNSEIRFLKKINYTVTFDSKEGSAVEALTVINGQTIKAPTAPTRENYIFLGWYTDEAYTTPFTFGTQPVMSDVKLYAQWTPVSPSGSEYTVKFDLNYENAPVVENVQTVGGQLLSAVTPERPGYKFGGWYLSANNSGDALTRPVTGYTFSADTTVYALWLSADETKLSAPVVTIESNKVVWETVHGANHYDVVITGPDGSAVLTQTNYVQTSVDFNFAEAEAGDYIVSVKANSAGGKTDSDVTVRYYKNKALEKVTGLTVVNNTLIFTGVDNADNYYVTIDCGNDDHEHTLLDIGDATTYNFSACSMQEGGIKFTVTAAADGYASSVSETYVYNRILAPVGGFRIVEETQTLKWDAVPYATNYFVSVRCGNASHDHALIDNGSSTSFSLKECSPAEGGILINVYPRTEGYNSPAASSYTYNKAMLASPFGIAVDGNVLSWNADPKATSYEIKIGDTTLTSTTNSIDLTDEIAWVVAADYKFQIKAIGDGVESLWSDTFDARYYAMEDSLAYKASVVSWKAVIGVSAYQVMVNDVVAATVENGATSAEIRLTQAGMNTISVRPFDETMFRYLDPVTIDVYAHTVTFDSRLGSGVEAIYLATGDKLPELAKSARDGYDFSGWYNMPGGPTASNKEFSGEYYNAHNDMTVYAYWKPATYQVTYDFWGGEGSKESDPVVFMDNYTLEVPVNKNDATVVFGGWYSLPNGEGVRYTNEKGVSVQPWEEYEGRTIYAYWLGDVLSYTLLQDGTYSVMAGSNISKLTTVKIPATVKNADGEDVSVTVVDGNAFKGCSTLTKISIPNTIDLVEVATAFSACSKLEEIEVYEVPGNRDVKYWSEGGALVYVDQPTSQTRIFLPLAMKGSFRIPDGVTTIALKAFAAVEIEEIIIPASVTQIDQTAFYNCKKLKKVIFEEAKEGEISSPLTIASKAFQNCTALESITVPSRFTVDAAKITELTSIFYGCTNLASIDVHKGNQLFSSVGGVLCDKNGTTIVYCPKGRSGVYTIPSGITAIGDYAFEDCKKITELVIPNHVTEIGAYAFRNNDKVTKITFQGGAIIDLDIGMYAFYACDELTTIVYEAGSRVATLGKYAFGYNRKLEKIDLPASLREVGDQAYYYCSAATSVVFEENGQEISFGSKVFQNCTGLTEINLPANVVDFEMSVFDGCTNIRSIFVDDNNQKFADIDGVLFTKDLSEIIFYSSGRTEKTYVLPTETTIIGAAAFQENKYLKSITIPNRVVEIKDNAFYECTSLDSVTIEEGETVLKLGKNVFGYTAVTDVTLPNRVKAIPYGLFYYCEELEKVTASSTITAIGERAFYYSSISEFAIPETVTEIGANAFYRTNLKEAKLSKNVKKVGDYAFAYTALTKGIIPSDVEEFGEYVYYYCELLTEVTIENGVKTIPSSSFSYTAIKSVVIPNSVEILGSNAFNLCAELETVTFEKGGTADLIVGWNTNTNKMYGYTFSGCAKLTSVAFPSRMTVLGERSFYNASNPAIKLKTVTFTETDEENNVVPSRLEKIGVYAFYGSGITSITIPKTVCNDEIVDAKTAQVLGVGNNAFYNCKDLTTVIFEEGGTLPVTIGASAFYGCSSLTKLVLPQRLTTAQGITSSKPVVLDGLPINALTNCSALAAIEMEATAPEGVTPGYAVKDGMLYTADMTRLYVCPMAKVGEVTIPKTVAVVGNNAFDGCSFITKITFANDYAEGETIPSLSIGENVSTTSTPTSTYVFDDCIGLTSLEIPARTTYIGKYAFDGCINLAKINVPAGITEIVEYTFSGCTGLKEITFDKDADGKTALTKIGAYAFQNFGATTIEIPASVKEIGESAFYGYSHASLVSVTFAKDADGNTALTKIGNNAFKYQLLQTIVIPDSVTTLGTTVFGDCANLVSVTLPKNLGSTFDVEYFSNCDALKTVTIADDAKNFKTIDGVLYNKTGQQIVFYPYGHGSTYVVPEGVTELRTESFYCNASITSITIASTVTYIRASAFQNCETLQEIIFATPEKEPTSGNLTIEAKAFYGCTGLTSLSFPKRLKEIKDSAFYCSAGKSQIKTVEFAEGCLVTKMGKDVFYQSLITEVEIPAKVTELNGTFSYCKSLEKVTFAAGSVIKTIGASAFDYTAVTEIEIPSTVTTIGNYAFRGTKLSSFTIPANVTSIGNSAFENVPLETIAIPQKVKTIGTKAFSHTSATSSKLTSVTFADNSACTSIGTYAFQYSRIKEIALPSGITTLSNYTFTGCDLLETVTFGPSTALKSIGTNVFENCSALKNIELPVINGTIGNSAFMNCSSLTSLTFQEGLTSIGSRAFMGCRDLESVSFPASLKTLTAYTSSTKDGPFSGCTSLEVVTFAADCALTALPVKAFYGCESLLAIAIPENVETIGDSAFEGCSSLVAVSTSAKLETIGASVFKDCTDLTTILFDVGLTSIGDYAFENCVSLTDMILPAALTEFGVSPFKGCVKFSNLYIDPANSTLATKEGVLYSVNEEGNPVTLIYYPSNRAGEFVIPETVTEFSPGAFVGAKFTTIKIPASVTAISEEAFYGCTELLSVELHDQILSIADRAFAACTKLASISIPDSVETIGANAFAGCVGLTAIEIADGVKTIGASAFEGCSQVETLTIPESVETINARAFAGMSALNKLTFTDGKKAVLTIGESAFEGANLNTLVIPGSVKAIGKYAFKDNSIAVVTFGEGVETIGEYSFEGMPLKSVVIPASVTKVDNYAFDGCATLSVLTFTKGGDVRLGIGNYAFRATAIEEVELPYRLGSKSTYVSQYSYKPDYAIGEYAFADCSKLAKVTFEMSGMQADYYDDLTIGKYAFQNCALLTSITFPDTLGNYSYSIGYGSQETMDAIGEGAFVGTGLTKVEFTESDKSINIGQEAFKGLKGLTAFNFPETVHYVKAGALSETGLVNVTIPENVSDLYMDRLFQNCVSLETVEILMDGTLTIEDSMFEGCTNLKSVTFPQREENATSGGVTTVASKAFKDCVNLTTLSNFDQLKYIHEFAFENCSSLETLNIPATITRIDENPFIGCEKLNLTVSEESNLYAVIEGILYGKVEVIEEVAEEGQEPTTVVSYVVDRVISVPTTKTEVTLVDTITTIGAYAFANCTKLASVVLPASTTTVETFAFYGCPDLKISVADGSDTLKVQDGLIYQVNTTVAEDETVTTTYVLMCAAANVSGTVAILDGTTEIMDRVFEDNTAITKVIFPEGLTTIGNYAFKGCTGITSIDLPESVTTIGTNAFEGCTNLEVVVSLGSVQELKAYTFYNCTSLSSITIPATTMKLGKYLFANTALTSIEIPYTVKAAFGTFDYMFAGCTELKSVVLNSAPNSYNWIDVGMFQGCSKLESITLPEKLRVIYENAFDGCVSLKSIVIDTASSDFMSIYAEAFNGWTAEQTIYLTSAVAKDSWTDWLKGCNANVVYGYVVGA